MLKFERTLEQLSGLGLLRFFPADADTRLELAKLVARMASNEDQVDWLVQRVIALCNEWPGPRVLRQIFCAKFKPADGLEVGSTEMFPDGPPNEVGGTECLAVRELQAQNGPIMALPPGRKVTADESLDLAVLKLASNRKM